MKEYSKRTNLSQNEKNIHKERIAFMIIDDEILFLKKVNYHILCGQSN